MYIATSCLDSIKIDVTLQLKPVVLKNHQVFALFMTNDLMR